MVQFKNFYIVQAWLILIVAVFFGASLASIQIVLGPKIEENKINEIKQRVPELVLSSTKLEELNKSGDILDVEFNVISVKKNKKIKAYNTYKAKDKSGNTIGYVIKATGQGYADKIELLFGLNKNVDKISGIYILAQKETPGLGNKIVEDNWQNQFKGKPATPTNPLKVVKTGAKDISDIDAITGATISSRNVCNIINSAVKDLKEPLGN